MLSKYRGEFFLVLGALFFSLSGIVATVVLKHLPAFRLAEFRSVTAVLILGTLVLLTRPEIIRMVRAEIPKLGLYGVIGFAMVHFGYLLGIQRGVPLALVLIIEFTAPIWIVLWIKFVRKSEVARSMWAAIALSLLGLIFVAKAWEGFTFDLFGTLGALGAAFALAVYFLMSQSQACPFTSSPVLDSETRTPPLGHGVAPSCCLALFSFFLPSPASSVLASLESDPSHGEQHEQRNHDPRGRNAFLDARYGSCRRSHTTKCRES